MKRRLLNIKRGGGLYDPDFQAWLDYNFLQGHYMTSDVTKLDACNQLILDRKARGKWATDDIFYKFAWNDLGMAQSSLVCMKRRIKAVVYGGMVYTLEGYLGNGTNGYIDALFNPFANGVNYKAADASISANIFNISNSNGALFGHDSTGNTRAFMASSSNSIRMNSFSSSSSGNFLSGGSGIGLISVNRKNNTELEQTVGVDYVKNSVSGSPALVNENLLIFKTQTLPSPNGKCSFFSAGGFISRTEVQNLRTDLNAYYLSIGLTELA